MTAVKYYFAYGSNMWESHMKDLSPSAVFVGPAKLQNYKIVERQYADIDKSDGDEVQGILWRIDNDQDFVQIDRYEGLPELYYRFQCEVSLLKTGEKIMTEVYEMTENTKKKANGISYNKEYRQKCREAALKYGLRSAY